MARKGHQDRGLLSKLDTTGKTLWYVRLMHDGKERRFGSFPLRPKPVNSMKRPRPSNMKAGSSPNGTSMAGYELVQEAIDRYLLNMEGGKTYGDHVFFAKWWGKQFAGKRLNAITVTGLETIRKELMQGRSMAESIKYIVLVASLFECGDQA